MGRDYFYFDDIFKFEGDVFGKANVFSVSVTKGQLDDAIAEIVLDFDNLKFLFGVSPILPLTHDRKDRIIRRFLPPSKSPNTLAYVTTSLKRNPNFYSFLGEAIMAILMRDIFGYKLSAAVLRDENTIIDTHSGVDCCFYDSKNKVIVLGEAKFIKKLKQGMRTIKKNFAVQDKLKNQLESLFKNAEKNRKSKRIILQSAEKSRFERLSFEDLLEMNLIFAGFVMHEDSHDASGEDLKNNCGFSSKDIERHVSTIFTGLKDLNYSLILFHLPVDSKEELITLTIDKAYQLYEENE